MFVYCGGGLDGGGGSVRAARQEEYRISSGDRLELKEAEALLEQRLADGYLVKPDVTLAVKEYSKRSFSILGEVAKPGYYELPKGEGVSLAQAGGFTNIADQGRILVQRRVEGRPTTLKLSFKDRSPERSVIGFEVQPGDVITVAESLF